MYNTSETMPAVFDYDLIIVDEAHRGYILDKEAGEDELLYRNQDDFVSKRFNPIILEYSLYFKPYCSIALYFITMSRQTVGHWSAKPC